MTTLSASNSNIRKAAFRNTRTFLLNNITGVGTKIFGSYPVTNINLPLIVVENGIKGEDDQAVNDTILGREILVPVTVYSKQSEKIDSLADEIDTVLLASSSNYIAQNFTLHRITDIGEGSQFIDVKGNKVHGKTLSVELSL